MTPSLSPSLFLVLLRAVLVLHPQPAGQRVPQAAGQGGGWPPPGCALPLVLDKGASGLQIHTWAVPCHHTHNTALCPQGGICRVFPPVCPGQQDSSHPYLSHAWHVTRDTRFYHPSLCNMLWSIFEGNIFICLEFGIKQTFFLMPLSTDFNHFDAAFYLNIFLFFHNLVFCL